MSDITGSRLAALLYEELHTLRFSVVHLDWLATVARGERLPTEGPVFGELRTALKRVGKRVEAGKWADAPPAKVSKATTIEAPPPMPKKPKRSSSGRERVIGGVAEAIAREAKRLTRVKGE